MGYSPWGCKRFGHNLATKQQNNRSAWLQRPLCSTALDYAQHACVHSCIRAQKIPLKGPSSCKGLSWTQVCICAVFCVIKYSRAFCPVYFKLHPSASYCLLSADLCQGPTGPKELEEEGFHDALGVDKSPWGLPWMLLSLTITSLSGSLPQSPIHKSITRSSHMSLRGGPQKTKIASLGLPLWLSSRSRGSVPLPQLSARLVISFC